MKTILTTYFLFLFLIIKAQIPDSSFQEISKEIKWTSLLDHPVTSIADGNYKDSKYSNRIYFLSVKDGLIHGQLICKGSTGILIEITNYFEGEKNGKSEHFINGKLSKLDYYQFGNSFEETFFYSSGKVKKRYLVLNQIYYISEYYENGFLKSFGASSLNGKTGFWTFRNENGFKLSEGEYQDGKKEGSWNFFNLKGRVIKIEKYINGKLTDSQEWEYIYEGNKIIQINKK